MKLDNILNLFNIRETEKEIFKICFESDGIGASEIAKKIGINRTSTYDFLDNLVKAGLIIESQKQGVKKFYVQKPEKIEELIKEKEGKVSVAKKSIEDLKNNFYQNKKRIAPKMQFYEGKEELRQMMKDLLLYQNITIYSFWPIENIIQALGKDFYREFHVKRVASNIKIKVIWPQKHTKQKEKHSFLEGSENFKREIRILPEDIDFNLGYTIYSNNVRFMSSQKEGYGFIIESQEMADTMKKQFEIIWKISKPLS
ncbi:MAG: helix-turn-helix domain-containing protein [Candidatus Moraniibacteriota bacterium]